MFQVNNTNITIWCEICSKLTIKIPERRQWQAFPKNVILVSVTIKGQQENIDLITLINFVDQTIETLSKYGEQLKAQMDFNLTQQAI